MEHRLTRWRAGAGGRIGRDVKRADIAGVGSESSRLTWEILESWMRERAQELIQRILEEEVTELLGREQSERKRAVDAAPGYRDGDAKPASTHHA